MRVCFTSDLHGDRKHYAALAELVRQDTPDVVILGGDLVGDIDLDGPVLPQVDELIRGFRGHLGAMRGAHPPVQIAGILGNHEIAPFRDALQDRVPQSEFALLDGGACWRFGGFTWVGYSCAPPSPHWAKDFERLDTRADEIPPFDGQVWKAERRVFEPVAAAAFFAEQPTMQEDLARMTIPAEPWILVAHAPPRASGLDQLPQVAHPIGSQAVRELIERGQPAVALHGHIHDAHQVTGRYAAEIGDTLCINPGQSHDHLHAVVFDVERPRETLKHTVLR
jgi:predicted phosphodiesterase